MLKLIYNIFRRWNNPLVSSFQIINTTKDEIVWGMSTSPTTRLNMYIHKTTDSVGICVCEFSYSIPTYNTTIIKVCDDLTVKDSCLEGPFTKAEVRDLAQFIEKELEPHKPYKVALDTVESWAKKYFTDVTVTSDLSSNEGSVSMLTPDGIYLKYKVEHIKGFYGPMVLSEQIKFSISPKRSKGEYVKTVQCEYGPYMEQIIDLEKMLNEAFSKLYVDEKPDSTDEDLLKAIGQASIIEAIQNVSVVTTQTDPPIGFKVLKRRNHYVEPKEVYEYMNGNIGAIKYVLFNETKKVTTVIFTDGTRITSKCTHLEEFDPEIGFAMCIMKRMYGNRTNFKKVIKDYMIASTHRNEVIQRKALKKAEKAVEVEQKKVRKKSKI